MVKVQIEVVSGSHTSCRIDSDARKRGETSRITGTSGVNVGRCFVFEAGLFIVGPLSGGDDQVLEDAGDLLYALGWFYMVDALHGVSVQADCVLKYG